MTQQVFFLDVFGNLKHKTITAKELSVIANNALKFCTDGWDQVEKAFSNGVIFSTNDDKSLLFYSTKPLKTLFDSCTAAEATPTTAPVNSSSAAQFMAIAV